MLALVRPHRQSLMLTKQLVNLAVPGFVLARREFWPKKVGKYGKRA
jgi:hypothetical protein